MDNGSAAALHADDPAVPHEEGGEAGQLPPACATARGRGRRCPHCGRSATICWGRSRAGRQRWRCTGCARTFSATTKTILAGLHRSDKFDAVLDDMLADVPRSCRKLGAVLGLDKMTIWAWRRRLGWRMAALAEQGRKPLAASSCIVIRESRKASREWADHAREPGSHPAPDRLRWIDYRRSILPLPQPMDRHRIAIAVESDDARRCWARAAPLSSAPTSVIALALGSEPLPMRGPLVFDTDREASTAPGDHRPSPGQNGLAHERSDEATASSRSTAREALVEQLERFLRPFRGPATRYLRLYVGWFVTRQSGGRADRLRSALLGRRPTLFSDMAESGPGRLGNDAGPAMSAAATG